MKTSLSKLTLPKPRMEKTGVVYAAIHCECGGTYIGETGQTLKLECQSIKEPETHIMPFPSMLTT